MLLATSYPVTVLPLHSWPSALLDGLAAPQGLAVRPLGNLAGFIGYASAATAPVQAFDALKGRRRVTAILMGKRHPSEFHP